MKIGSLKRTTGFFTNVQSFNEEDSNYMNKLKYMLCSMCTILVLSISVSGCGAKNIQSNGNLTESADKTQADSSQGDTSTNGNQVNADVITDNNQANADLAMGDNQEGSESATGDKQTNSNGSQTDTAWVGDDYPYEQELQIIDDNYRNYYEIFVYSFYDSDGDGIGDLNGVTQKLDYIQDMGFNGIWLMPVFQSTTYHKYDITDYLKIDSEYGTQEDMQKLIEECHRRGIRIILDFVMNHTSSQHPWFTQACKYLQELPQGQEPDEAECPYIEYYHFAKEQKSGYYQVKGTDWYYEGVFWSEMPDLNLENQALRAELEQIAKYWIDMGIDGFRMDAAMHFEENDTTVNNEILNWFYQYCTSQNPEFYMVSEVWANEATIADYYASLTPSMFNFDLADKEGKLIKAARGMYKAANLVQAMLKYQTDFAGNNPDYIDAPFITNHDMGRVANALRNDADDLKMAGGLLMTLSGNPFVYYGEEIGMASSGTKDENKRLPFIWSDSAQEGMTKGPKDADAGIVSVFAGAQEQQQDEDSILNYYKRAIRLRNENPELARGEIKVIDTLCDGHQAVITKTWNNSTIGVVYNTSDESMEIELKDQAVENMAIRGYLTLHGEAVTLTDGVLVMPAKSICILK